MKTKFSKNSTTPIDLSGLIRVSIVALIVMISIIAAVKLVAAAKLMIFG